jgi:hypothetical protein
MRMPILFDSPASKISPCALLVAALAVALCGAQGTAGQAPAAAPVTKPAAAAHKTVHPHTRKGKAHLAAAAGQAATQAAPAPEQPKAPEAPHWPANEHAALAAVTWDSHGLRIEATNSSLQQILKDVSTATGAKVEGLGTDERVFGEFGPGQARDVISKLLHGSGYNVIMIGDQGQGAPRQIVLSSRHSGNTQASASKSATDADDDDAADDVEEQPQTPPAPLIRPGFAPGGQQRPPQMPPRTMPPN